MAFTTNQAMALVDLYTIPDNAIDENEEQLALINLYVPDGLATPNPGTTLDPGPTEQVFRGSKKTRSFKGGAFRKGIR